MTSFRSKSSLARSGDTATSKTSEMSEPVIKLRDLPRLISVDKNGVLKINLLPSKKTTLVGKHPTILNVINNLQLQHRPDLYNSSVLKILIIAREKFDFSRFGR